MFIGRVNSTSFSNAKERLVKFLGWGKNDVQSQKEASPYGTDSNPIKNMVAIYAQTANGSESIVIGYINKNQLADVGEHRIYATDSDGDLKGSIWLKKNGAIEIKATGDTTQPIKLNTGQYKAVLGDKLTTTLNDVVSLLSVINIWGQTVTPPLPDQTTAISQIISDIGEILLNNVTLD